MFEVNCIDHVRNLFNDEWISAQDFAEILNILNAKDFLGGKDEPDVIFNNVRELGDWYLQSLNIPYEIRIFVNTQALGRAITRERSKTYRLLSSGVVFKTRYVTSFELKEMAWQREREEKRRREKEEEKQREMQEEKTRRRKKRKKKRDKVKRLQK